MIDEKKLIEDLVYCKGLGRRGVEAVLETINKQPKVGEWIPCSERLPEKPMFADQGYIVQQKHVTDPFCLYWNGENWTDVYNEIEEDVIAWMPLPEPYREKV